jgi:hypothetical protein
MSKSAYEADKTLVIRLDRALDLGAAPTGVDGEPGEGEVRSTLPFLSWK